MSLELTNPLDAGAGAAVRNALRILAEVRAEMDHDLPAARRSLDRLAQALDPAAETRHANLLVRGGLSPWQLRRVCEHIAAHLEDPLAIEDLANLARVSAGHFNRAFRRSLGVTPHTFILSKRIDRAKDLLLTTEAPIREIALDCGFSDQAHLTRLFSRSEGVGPAAWRRLNAAPVHFAKAA